MIVPSVSSPSAASAASSQPESFIYEIVESELLPVVDLSRSIRSEWLSESFGDKWTHFLRRYKVPVLGGYYCALVLYFFGFFSAARVGRWVSICVITTGTCGALASVSLLRSDLVNLLLRTYEVWFFTTVSALSSVLLAVYFSDLRALLMPPFWLGVQSSVLLDANITMGWHFILPSLLVVMFLLVLITFIGLGILDETHSFVLLPGETRTMTVEIALVNGWSTIALLLCRNIYRRREAVKKLGAVSKLVQCVSLRAKVKLVRVTSPGSPPAPRSLQSQRSRSFRGLIRVKSAAEVTDPLLPVQMRLAATGEYFDAANTLLSVTRFAPVGGILPLWMRLWLLSVALTGLTLTSCSLILAAQSGSKYIAVGLGALSATVIVVVVSLATSQRQLLRRIILSFDFAFLSFQITFAHLSLCELLYWDHRCFGVYASLLWMHWVLTLDAITPVAKRRWSIRVWFAAVVMLLFILAQLVVGLCLVLDLGVDFQDRSVYDVKLWGHEIHFRVLPLLLSRLVILLSWSCRVLWRIWWQQGDELIIVQGAITFEGNLRLLKPRATQISLNDTAAAVGGIHLGELVS